MKDAISGKNDLKAALRATLRAHDTYEAEISTLKATIAELKGVNEQLEAEVQDYEEQEAAAKRRGD